MGSPSASTGGGGGGSPNQMAKDKAKKDREEKAKTKTKFGYTKPKNKNIVETIIDKSPVLNILKNNPISKKTEEVNRKFFEEKVKPANKSKYSNYEDYIRARGRGEVDAYGREIMSTGNDGGATESSGVVVQAPKVETTPTESEVSQATATEAEDPIKLRKRKAKARGRSPTILTGVTGVTGSLTLGKPSLLGR